MNRTERGCARAEEQVFKTRELMPSGPVVESESRIESKLSTLSGEKDTESRNSWAQLGKVCTENDGFGTQDLEANTEFRHLAISCALSAVWPFEVREGMEGEHTAETDLTRCHRDLEERDRFESSDLRLESCCFLAHLRVDTHLLRALWKELRLPSVGFAFHVAKASCFRTTASLPASVYNGREEGSDNSTRDRINLCMREQI